MNQVLLEAIAYAQSQGETARFYTEDEQITHKNGHLCFLHEVRPDGWVVTWPHGGKTKGENPGDFVKGWDY